MKYKITITTSDGRTLEVRLTAQNQADAVGRIAKQPQVLEYLNGATIARTEVAPDNDRSGDVLFFDACELYHADDNPNGHLLAVRHRDTGLIVEFTKHAFNRTAHTANPDRSAQLDAMTAATAQRTIADWLQFYRPELLYPTITTEQKLLRQLSIAADNAGYTAPDLAALSGVQEKTVQKLIDGNPDALHFCKVGALADIANALGYELTLTPSSQKTE